MSIALRFEVLCLCWSAVRYRVSLWLEVRAGGQSKRSRLQYGKRSTAESYLRHHVALTLTGGAFEAIESFLTLITHTYVISCQPCGGDRSHMCGATWRNSVYKSAGAAPAPAPPAPRPRKRAKRGRRKSREECRREVGREERRREEGEVKREKRQER